MANLTQANTALTQQLTTANKEITATQKTPADLKEILQDMKIQTGSWRDKSDRRKGNGG